MVFSACVSRFYNHLRLKNASNTISTETGIDCGISYQKTCKLQESLEEQLMIHTKSSGPQLLKFNELPCIFFQNIIVHHLANLCNSGL